MYFIVQFSMTSPFWRKYGSLLPSRQCWQWSLYCMEQNAEIDYGPYPLLLNLSMFWYITVFKASAGITCSGMTTMYFNFQKTSHKSLHLQLYKPSNTTYPFTAFSEPTVPPSASFPLDLCRTHTRSRLVNISNFCKQSCTSLISIAVPMNDLSISLPFILWFTQPPVLKLKTYLLILYNKVFNSLLSSSFSNDAFHLFIPVLFYI